MTCAFCDIGNRESTRLIRNNKHTVVVLSNPRLVPGHMLVIPRRHVEKMSELSKDEREEFIDETIKMQDLVLERFAPGCDVSEHYRPFIADNGLKVGHLHMHIRPRTLNDELYEKVLVHEKAVFAPLSDEEEDRMKKLFQ